MAETPTRIIREAECHRLTGISRSRRFELEKQGKFPRRVKLGAAASGYVLQEIEAWIAAKIAERDSAAA